MDFRYYSKLFAKNLYLYVINVHNFTLISCKPWIIFILFYGFAVFLIFILNDSHASLCVLRKNFLDILIYNGTSTNPARSDIDQWKYQWS
jgi:hypothetical protein